MGGGGAFGIALYEELDEAWLVWGVMVRDNGRECGK